MSYQITIPQIKSVMISPNPAAINEKITFSVTVEEATITLEAETRPSGTFYSGEE